MIQGRIHSFQSLGAVDGPGIRFVVFLQGCPLRCGCCHNPDTQAMIGGTLQSPEQVLDRALRYREYFGTEGGITLSGGEPLLQADFALALFRAAHRENLNTCLDTSGCLWSPTVEALLLETDRVLLDIKYTTETLYQSEVGCALQQPIEFLDRLNERDIPTTLRQVIIPTLNDNEENIRALSAIATRHACVDKVELLPFKKLCQSKYDAMGIRFPHGHLPEPTPEQMRRLESLLRPL